MTRENPWFCRRPCAWDDHSRNARGQSRCGRGGAARRHHVCVRDRRPLDVPRMFLCERADGSGFGPTLQLVSYLHFQHRPLSFTGSLGVGCESLLKVKVKDSVGLRPYSQLECSAAQLTESKGKGQCGPRRELRVKVKTSKTPTRQPTTAPPPSPPARVPDLGERHRSARVVSGRVHRVKKV